MMNVNYAHGVAAGPMQGYMQQQAFVPPLPDSQPPPPLPDEPPPPLPDGPPPEQAQHRAQLQGMAVQMHMQGVQPGIAGTAMNGYTAGNSGMQQMQPQQQTWDQAGQVQSQGMGTQQQAWGNGTGMQSQGMGTQQVGLEMQQQWGQQPGTGVGLQQQLLHGNAPGTQQWGQQQWGQQQQQWVQQMNMQQQWGQLQYGQQQSYGMQQQGMMGQNQSTMSQPNMITQQGMQSQQMMMQQQMQLQQQQQQQEYERQQVLMQKQYQRQQEYQQMLMEKQHQQQQMQQTGYSQAGMGQWQQQQQQYMQGGGQQQMWPVAQQQMSHMPQMPQPPPPPRPAAMQQPPQVQQHQQPYHAPLQPGVAHAVDMAASLIQTPALAPSAMQQQLPAAAAAPASLEPPAPVDLRTLLQPPGRSQRPKRLLLILRGLPGSGKSYVAKAIRAKELEHSSTAPRLHSIDDYFMVDVEKEVAADGTVVSASSSSSLRRQGSVGVKRRLVVEQEYQHDPELEASYWKSLLRALGKTLASGDHSLVLLDAPAPKADQVKEAWMAAQSEGYEVMVVQPLTMDPEVCFKQNIHGRSLQDIKAMASAFEPPPSMYTVATATNLFKAEGPGDTPIGDVDMTVDEAAAEQGSGIAAAGSPAKQQQKPRSSRWEDEESEAQAAILATAAAAVPDSSETIFGGTTTAAEDKAERDSAEGDDAAAVDGTGSSSSSRHKKKPKLSVQMNLDIDSEALLAGVNQALEALDSEGAASLHTPAGPGGAGMQDDVRRGDRGGSGRGAGSSMSMGGSYNSGTGKTGILKSVGTPGSSKKKVRWPDDVMQDAEVDQPTGFSIARPQRQLEEVFWVAGLGPKGCWLYDDQEEDEEASAAAAGAAGGGVQTVRQGRQVQQGLAGQYKHHNSFADQVRAEHQSEHNAFRAILLGHGHATAGTQRQR